MKACPTCRRRFVDSQAACPLDESVLGAGDGTTDKGLGRVLGSYRLISHLGEGGMGSVYIAAHTRLNRHVAIKVLRPELGNRKDHIVRFFDEARLVNKLKHPNIVESIDLVEDVVDGAYCVMELLHGPDLKHRLTQGPLPIESVLHVGAEIADALSAVHALGVVHRDLKPENLILIKRAGRDDFVKLIDFGVAQISDEGATGIPFGTAAYMAPEQAAGERVDGRADVYALGVLLYEMATGRHPFPSSTDNEYLLRHADEEPEPPSTMRAMPRSLENAILRCLAKQPGDRFPSAAAVAVALRAIDPDESDRRSKLPWVIGAIAAVAVAAAAAVVVPRMLRDDAKAPVAAQTPSPAPAPVTAPVVEAPATVELEFTSTPPGASVMRAGETIALGVTPFKTTLARSDRPTTVRFTLAGHHDETRELRLDTPSTLAVPLRALPPVAVTRPRPTPTTSEPRPAKPAGSGAKPTGVQREGVMDPFAN